MIRDITVAIPIVYSVPKDTTQHLENFEPLPIENQVITFHFWDWAFQGSANLKYPNKEPGMYPHPQDGWTYAGINSLLSKADRIRDMGCEVYIGEVGINSANPSAARFFRDFTEACKHHGFDLTIHAYKEDPMWDYEANNHTAWQVLLDWLKG